MLTPPRTRSGRPFRLQLLPLVQRQNPRNPSSIRALAFSSSARACATRSICAKTCDSSGRSASMSGSKIASFFLQCRAQVDQFQAALLEQSIDSLLLIGAQPQPLHQHRIRPPSPWRTAMKAAFHRQGASRPSGGDGGRSLRRKQRPQRTPQLIARHNSCHDYSCTTNFIRGSIDDGNLSRHLSVHLVQQSRVAARRLLCARKEPSSRARTPRPAATSSPKDARLSRTALPAARGNGQRCLGRLILAPSAYRAAKFCPMLREDSPARMRQAGHGIQMPRHAGLRVAQQTFRKLI